MLARTRHSPDPPVLELQGGSRRAPAPGDRGLGARSKPRDVSGRVDGVGGRDETRRHRTCLERPRDGIGGPERLGLPDEVDLEARFATCDELLDLLGQVARYHPGPLAPGPGELVQEGDDDRPAVDGQHGLRPPLGDGPEATAFPGRHHDRVHELPGEERANGERAA